MGIGRDKTRKDDHDLNAVERFIAGLGEDGWELVNGSFNDRHSWTCFFKRPIPT